MTVQKARKPRAQKVEAVQEVVVDLGTIRVGSEIIVNHGSDGNGKLVRHKDHVATVTAIYLDGSVRVGSGDVYRLEPAVKAKGNAKWQTAMPRMLKQHIAA